VSETPKGRGICVSPTHIAVEVTCYGVENWNLDLVSCKALEPLDAFVVGGRGIHHKDVECEPCGEADCT